MYSPLLVFFPVVCNFWFRVFKILNIPQEAKLGLGAIGAKFGKLSGDNTDNLNFLFTLAKRYIFVIQVVSFVLNLDNFIFMLKQYYNLEKVCFL